LVGHNLGTVHDFSKKEVRRQRTSINLWGNPHSTQGGKMRFHPNTMERLCHKKWEPKNKVRVADLKNRRVFATIELTYTLYLIL
jgi:hypothetical protein